MDSRRTCLPFFCVLIVVLLSGRSGFAQVALDKSEVEGPVGVGWRTFLEDRTDSREAVPAGAYDRAASDWSRIPPAFPRDVSGTGPNVADRAVTQNGDLNDDGIVDVSDVVLMVQSIFLGETIPSPARCGASRLNGDANADGMLDQTDCLYLLRYLYYSGPAPVPCDQDGLGGAAGVSGVDGTVWAPIGPNPILQGTSNVNGRVSAIAINPNNPNVIYQGASGGGVWRTTDGGAAWTPLYDQQVSLGVGEPTAIAIDPNDTNVIYAGTSGRFVLNISKGILKSTDGGGSWIVLGSDFPADNTGNADSTFAGRSVNVIIVDPANSNVLYAGASNGLYRSTDGGRNWTPGTGGGGDARSLVLDSSSPAANRILYAGLNGVGVVQSTDGGQNWNQVLNAATPAVMTALAGGTIGHVVVALAPPASPPNPAGVQVLYVTMAGGGTAPDPVGIFQSTDQGTTWGQQAATGLGSNTQGGYDLTMAVDPASPGDGTGDIIYYGAVGQFRSNDAGANFAAISNGQHVDSHAGWTFVPQPAPAQSTVYTGNDGGIFRSDDGGATWSGTGLPGAPATINAGGLQTALFYNLDIRPDAVGGVTIGTLQDNGTVRTTGGVAWTDTQGGDGWDFGFDADAITAYVTSGFWSPAPCTRLWRSGDAGATWPTDITPWGTTTDQGCYLSPVAADLSLPGTLYVSGNQNLWQSQDNGNNWRIINNFGGTAQLSVAPANSSNVAAAVGTQVFVTTNALAASVGPPSGVQFTNITRNLPNRGVTRVAFDPNDPTVLYATLNGFGGGHVFRTTIGGTAWTDLSPALDVPFNALVLDGAPAPTSIYVGTDLGVLRSVDSGQTWTTLDDIHLPNVPVTDLVINSQASVLRAATFGRGAFELVTPSGPVISVHAENGLQFGSVCDGPSRLVLQVFNVGADDLVIHSVQRLMGATSFQVLPNPSTPVLLVPGAEVDFTVEFTPATPGTEELALIRIASDDPSAPVFDIMASGTGGVSRILTAIAAGGDFGDVCVGSQEDLDLTINNSGGCDLRVTDLSSSSGQFQVASVMSFPVVIHAGDSTRVPIRFQPTSFGAKSANITVASNDPTAATKLVPVSGFVPSGELRVTGSSDFGDVCPGVLAEKTISVCNVGACNLEVSSVAFEPPCDDFTLINNPFPATVSPDSCLDVVIRFTPTSSGPKMCTLVIRSDDPDTPVKSLTVTANTPFPSIDVPPDLAFPPTVIQPLGACVSLEHFPISNTGTCDLRITAVEITGDPDEYSLVGLPSFPIILEPGHIAGEGDLRIGFAPEAVAREISGEISVTYVSDGVTGEMTTVTRKLCGEGVKTGARVVVTQGGVPFANVEKLQLLRINANRNRTATDLDTVDVSMDLAPVDVTPSLPCEPFTYHREFGGESNQIQLLPGFYQVSATVIVGGKRTTKMVGFNVDTCDFNDEIDIEF